MSSEALNLYEKETQHFLSTVEKCWSPDCDGTLHLLEKPEEYESEGQKYLRMLTCSKCGKSYSFWTFQQWLRNKRYGARRTLHDAREQRADARMDYNRAVNQAKKELAESLERIKKEVDRARETLSMLKERAKKQNLCPKCGSTLVETASGTICPRCIPESAERTATGIVH